MGNFSYLSMSQDGEAYLFARLKKKWAGAVCGTRPRPYVSAVTAW